MGVRYRKVWGVDGEVREGDATEIRPTPRWRIETPFEEALEQGELIRFDWRCRECGMPHQTTHTYGRNFKPLQCSRCGHTQELCIVIPD